MSPPRGKRISPHEQAVLAALSREWMSAGQVAVNANVAPRTARLHLRAAVRSGIAETRPTWPAYEYRTKGKK